MEKMRVLFVCMGNICRSPTAQGMFEALVEEAQLTGRIHIDSAGTHAYHVDLGRQRARRVDPADFESFDYVVAMDRSNLDDLHTICPDAHREKLCLLLDFARHLSQQDVPDPYYGGAQGFERVLDLVEEGARGLLEDIRRRLS